MLKAAFTANAALFEAKLANALPGLRLPPSVCTAKVFVGAAVVCNFDSERTAARLVTTAGPGTDETDVVAAASFVCSMTAEELLALLSDCTVVE